MASMFDYARIRRGVRKGRERGCWVYIPQEQLENAGIDTADDPPGYKTWQGRKRTILVQLYPKGSE